MFIISLYVNAYHLLTTCSRHLFCWLRQHCWRHHLVIRVVARPYVKPSIFQAVGEVVTAVVSLELLIITDDLGGSINGGTHSHHPKFSGIFHEINHPAMGVPPFRETPISPHILGISFDICGSLVRNQSGRLMISGLLESVLGVELAPVEEFLLSHIFILVYP